MHVTLDSIDIREFFPLAAEPTPLSHSKWLKQLSDRMTGFFFHSRHSNTLVVTVGDSWTWGQCLGGYNEIKTYKDDDWQTINGLVTNVNTDRLNNAYGNLLSQRLNSDWLNLAFPGWSNMHMSQAVQNLGQVIPSLHYSNIFIIVTLTEVGRWFNTHVDINIDHKKLFHKLHHPTELLGRLNSIAIDDITACLNKFSHVKLLVGTNFVDPIGLDNLLPEQRLSKPWYQLLDIVLDTTSHTITEYAWSNFLRSIDCNLVPSELHLIFKPWILDIIQQEKTWMENVSKSSFINDFHPSPMAHKIWADYVGRHLSC